MESQKSIEKNPSPCNENLKLGDICDSCMRGVMLPPGGLEYYKNFLGNPNPPPARGHDRIVCPRCGHWHYSTAKKFSTGFEGKTSDKEGKTTFGSDVSLDVEG